MEPSLAVEGGTGFLLGKQGADGFWRDFHTPAGEATEWPTGFVGTCLYLAGVRAAAVERAADALVANQNEDGGWGYHEDAPTDADSTACALLLLSLVGGRDDACRRAAACLVGYRRGADSGIATYADPGPIRRFMGVGRWMPFRGWCSPQTEVTAMAGRAFAAGGRKPDADAAWRFVRSKQRADGSWASYWWTSAHYATAQAVQLALRVGDRDRASRAAEWVLRDQNDDGTWSAPGAPASAFATALSLLTLVSVNGGGEPVERAVASLTGLQDDDGGWPSHPIMRIPTPGDVDPDRRRRFIHIQVGRGFLVPDQHRTFTTAVCVAALVRARSLE
jgi:squalene cyclase